MIGIIQEIEMGIYKDTHGNQVELFEIGEEELTEKSVAIYRTVNRSRYIENGMILTMGYDTFKKMYKLVESKNVN